MYKQASKLKLRFQTPKGLLNVESLWELPLANLDSIAIVLEQEYKNSGKKSFLVAKSKKDKEIKLKFDIVIDILTTKVEEAAALKEISDNKEHNQKILRLIKDKQEQELGSKSIAELTKMLK